MTSVALVLAYTVAVGFGLFGVMALSRAITQAVDRRWSTVLITALVVWYGLTTALGVTDVFRADSPQNARFPMLGLGLAAPLLCLLASTWLAPPLSALIRSPRSVTASLIEVHSWRIAGVGFLILAAVHHLPAVFALPAGIGDILIGISASRIASRVRAGRPRAGIIWNILGLADLVMAIVLGVTAAPGALHLMATNPTTLAMSITPMVLVPTFMVPLSMWLHIISLRSLTAAPPPRIPGYR
jgi:hypothetical protein